MTSVVLTIISIYRKNGAQWGRLIRLYWFLIAGFVCLFVPVEVIAAEDFALDQTTLQWAEQHYGNMGPLRLLAWQDFMRQLDKDEPVIVEQVNSFFNRLEFVSDAQHWGQSDYWATPNEFVASGGGDCEDFAITKFFSLRILGIPSAKLAFNYVFSRRLNQNHLVLAYYPVPEREPLVLDNLMDAIKPASQRTDLIPIYSFDASTMWESKGFGKGKKIGDSRRIRSWRELLMRMETK